MVSLKGNQVEVRPSIGGPTEMKHMKHVKYVLPADQYIKHVPNYSAFGRKAALRMNPNKIPDLHWQLANTYHTTNIKQSELQTSNMVTPSVDVHTISHAGGRKYENACVVTLNTDNIHFNSNVNTVVCFISGKT